MSQPSSKADLDLPRMPGADRPLTERPLEAPSTAAAPLVFAADTPSEVEGNVPGTVPAPALRPTVSASDSGDLAPGQTVGDFELLAVLGRGSFATVWLAYQISLGRQIALKVSRHCGSEAHTLAVLEHDYIVRVFSESVEPRTGLRLLCMQYVNGTTLECVIRALAGKRHRPLTGRDLVETIDSLCERPALFDPAALHDRDQLLRADFVEAVCWLGERLAEALAHAHRLGVLHRDVKPANILLSCYGRPMLADFNIALDPEHARGMTGMLFGGTLLYMAPEHLDAFNPQDPTTPEAVDERSDIFALGVVLFELLMGRCPFRPPSRGVSPAEQMRAMAAERRLEPPPRPEGPEVLQRVLQRCLEPDPARRYQSAEALARSLEGCREHWWVQKEVPPADALTRLVRAHPFAVGLALVLVPHILGSVVNIGYNSLRIVERLTAVQQATFQRLVLLYNLVVYSICLVILWWQLLPVYRTWRGLSGDGRKLEGVCNQKAPHWPGEVRKRIRASK